MPKPSSNLPVPTRKTPRQATSRVAFVSEPPEPGDPLLAFEPYVHKRPRANSITPDLQREFVAHLAATGIVTSAAKHIGRSMEALYKLRQMPGAQGFAAAWERAAQLGVNRLEDTALARAIEGSERKIIRGGEVVATERAHNESLVMFFLRNRLPERYSKEKDIGPGHPVYEKVREEYAEMKRKEANDPAKIKAIHDSIDRKVAVWRAEYEAQWDAQRKAQRDAHGDARRRAEGAGDERFDEEDATRL